MKHLDRMYLKTIMLGQKIDQKNFYRFAVVERSRLVLLGVDHVLKCLKSLFID